MSLVNEAAAVAAARVLSAGGTVFEALTAAAPHIGGEAIRQAVAAERLAGIDSVTGGARTYLDTYERALDDVLKHAEVTS